MSDTVVDVKNSEIKNVVFEHMLEDADWAFCGICALLQACTRFLVQAIGFESRAGIVSPSGYFFRVPSNSKRHMILVIGSKFSIISDKVLYGSTDKATI